MTARWGHRGEVPSVVENAGCGIYALLILFIVAACALLGGLL